MKNTLSILLLMVLGLAVLLISSCGKPTVPNFEEYGIPSSVWDYEHVVWFDLNYVDQAKGSANVDIWMSARGEDPNATLKIVADDIDFDEIISYSQGKIYHSGSYTLLNLDQTVTYKIVCGESTYEGEIALATWPKQVEVTTWPEFNEDVNYSASWTITSDPKFHLIDAGAYGAETDIEVLRQIEGMERNYTLNQSSWSDIKPIEEFFFGINAIGYEMLEKNKVLVVGIAGVYDYWPDNGGEDKSIQREKNPFRFMDQVQQDINK